MKLRDILAVRPVPPMPIEPLSNEVERWLCPHCGRVAAIEDVFPSEDGERTLTMWRCDPCEVVAVTPHTIHQPPSGWVKRTEQ